jgi:TRAP-type C4-dicarboxylate transport system substrate-binding protein
MNTTLGAAAVIVACSLTTTAWGANWNMPTPYPEGDFHTENIKQFAEDVEEMTDGELTITVHSAGSLFKHPEIKRAVQTRQAEIGEVLISLLSNEDPIFAVDSLPFRATSYEDARRLWEAQRPVLERRLEEQDLKLLYAVPWPPQGLYTNKEVDEISDMKGMKFRSYNAITARLAELMGAIPTQVEVPEIPQAFATGLVDAMITSPTTGVSSQAWDFVNRYYDTNAFLPKNMVIVNKRVFDRLDEGAQQAVLEAAKKAEERGWRMSKQAEEENTKVLAEHGVEISEPSERLRQELADIGEQMTQEWLKEAGPEGEQIIQAYGQ